MNLILLLILWFLLTDLIRNHWFKDYFFQRHVKRFGSKNIGYFQMFDEKWFTKWQKVYLFLLNSHLTRYWFRWLMRIHKDYPYKAKITHIAPHYTDITINGKLFHIPCYLTERKFRTHNKFSKRTYHAFRYVWWALHYADALVNACRPAPVPGGVFAFDTLVAYPAAGANSPCDGYAARTGVDETFAVITAGNGSVIDVSATTLRVFQLLASAILDQYAQNYRAIFMFDTSSLTTSSIVTAAALSLFNSPLGKSNQLGDVSAHCVSITTGQSNTIVNADYNIANYGTISFGEVIYAAWAAGYNAFTFNAVGVNSVSKISISKYATISAWDLNGSFTGTWGSGKYSRFGCYSADQTGAAQDPMLTVTFFPEPDMTALNCENASMFEGILKQMIVNTDGTPYLTCDNKDESWLSLLKQMIVVLPDGTYALRVKEATI